jgi:hypothetical protein
MPHHMLFQPVGEQVDTPGSWCQAWGCTAQTRGEDHSLLSVPYPRGHSIDHQVCFKTGNPVFMLTVL